MIRSEYINYFCLGNVTYMHFETCVGFFPVIIVLVKETNVKTNLLLIIKSYKYLYSETLRLKVHDKPKSTVCLLPLVSIPESPCLVFVFTVTCRRASRWRCSWRSVRRVGRCTAPSLPTSASRGPTRRPTNTVYWPWDLNDNRIRGLPKQICQTHSDSPLKEI